MRFRFVLAMLSVFSFFFSLAGIENSVLVVVGTRPEAVKLVPLHQNLLRQKIPSLLCSTGQHSDLLNDVLRQLGAKPDFDFQIMRPKQDLFDVTESVLHKMKELLQAASPALVVVQGDTTSAMAAALAAFYLCIPIAHVEAGLRSRNAFRPFPEEMNRRLISQIASYHFAPTQTAAANLLEEGVPAERIYCTGNTVVDALYSMRSKLAEGEAAPSPWLEKIMAQWQEEGKTIMLLTAHRRESFDGGLARIFSAASRALREHPRLQILYPMHPHPEIEKVFAASKLSEAPNLFLSHPLSYQDLVYALDRVDFVASDSGGIQEEAVSLHKKTLVLRCETERQEAFETGQAILTGTDEESILAAIRLLCAEERQAVLPLCSLYGDGHANERIASILSEILRFRSLQEAR